MRIDIRGETCGVELVRVSLSVPRLAVSGPSCAESRSSPLCRHKRRPSIFTCVFCLVSSFAARCRGSKAFRLQTEQGKVGCGISVGGMALYLHVIRIVTVLQHLSVLTCGQAYVIARAEFTEAQHKAYDRASDPK